MKSDRKKVVTILNKYARNRDSLISILQDIQYEYHLSN